MSVRHLAVVCGAIGAIVVTTACEPLIRDFAGKGVAATCPGSIVQLEFHPEGDIEARADGKTIAVADVRSGDLKDDVCEMTPSPSSYNQGGVRYARVKTPTTVTCRFPGRLVVTISPVSPSWAGKRAAGNSVGLVVGRRFTRNLGPHRTILASATVLERSSESDLVFVRRFCRPS
jgi:hypothetical protein